VTSLLFFPSTSFLRPLYCIDTDSFLDDLISSPIIANLPESHVFLDLLIDGCDPSPENFGTFSLEMAHVGANSVVF